MTRSWAYNSLIPGQTTGFSTIIGQSLTQLAGRGTPFASILPANDRTMSNYGAGFVGKWRGLHATYAREFQTVHAFVDLTYLTIGDVDIPARNRSPPPLISPRSPKAYPIDNRLDFRRRGRSTWQPHLIPAPSN